MNSDGGSIYESMARGECRRRGIDPDAQHSNGLRNWENEAQIIYSMHPGIGAPPIVNRASHPSLAAVPQTDGTVSKAQETHAPATEKTAADPAQYDQSSAGSAVNRSDAAAS